MQPVFVTGGTGYIGRALIARLLREGYSVTALARAGSQHRLPPGTVVVIGDALRADTFALGIPVGATLVHLVGTAHPSPAKAGEFRRVDLASTAAAAEAAIRAGAAHFIYVSVAQPAPVMKAYVAARRAGEQMVRATTLPATILRPWYVLGPGRRWPLLLLPVYGLLRYIPPAREAALRLGLVTRRQMINALAHAVRTPPADGGVAILGVPEIRAAPA